MDLKAGSRWTSAVSDVEVVVVKAPAGELSLTCGGHEMLPLGGEGSGGAVEAGQDAAIAVGKRYSDEAGEIELLVTKGGVGSLAVGGVVLDIKSAKPLPSSD
jgi:hypothetical protein